MNVLVVDDDIDLCALLSRFLEKNGHRVHAAQDAREALDILQREAIGMVITDLMMPHLDGIDFTEQVKSDPRFKDLPIIMMTASSGDDRVEQSLRKGVAMTLTKPFDFNQLLDLVRFAE